MSKKSNYIIVGILLLILCFSVAYTSYSIVLTTPGKAIPSDIWDIKFTNVKTSNNDKDYSISDNNQELIITPSFSRSGEKTYEITIENKGNVDGLIPDDSNPIIWEVNDESQYIEYEISKINEVKAGESITFTIKFRSYIEPELENEITAREQLVGKINFKRN